MKFIIALLLIISIYSCKSTKPINYSFEATAVSDSVLSVLREDIAKFGGKLENVKWFCVVRQSHGGYELIVNRVFGDKSSPLNRTIKSTTRYLTVTPKLSIPVVLETDILSKDFRKAGVGQINWGGHYFRIESQSGSFKVVETAELF